MIGNKESASEVEAQYETIFLNPETRDGRPNPRYAIQVNRTDCFFFYTLFNGKEKRGYSLACGFIGHRAPDESSFLFHMLYIFYTQFNGRGYDKGGIMFLDIFVFIMSAVVLIVGSLVAVVLSISDITITIERVEGNAYKVKKVYIE